jgi:hypothetical protein
MYITANEKSLTPYIVTSQDSEPVRWRVMSRGVRLGIDFVLWQQLKPDVNGKLLLEYVNSIFVPCLNELWESEEFEACEMISLIDNCSPYVSNDIVVILARVRVRIITFAYHTTYIFQMLNVMLFGALKKYVTSLETLDEKQPADAFLLKVYHDFKQIMVEVNIWGAITAIDFNHDIE